MKSKFHQLPGIVGFGWLLLICCGVCAADRNTTTERELDKEIVTLLAKRSSLIIVGEPIGYSMQDRYGMALNAAIPFQVRVLRVLAGNGAAAHQAIQVGVTRDEVMFRYEKGKAFVFFLHHDPNQGKVTQAPSTRTEWRVVSDYLGVQAHSLTLERMIQATNNTHESTPQ
ncbi:MAG: hypothetical protein J0L84_09560 [Verrucomicrobia bacterium]|nr:hypothetical protein [Verrucomicrobiota bacterium]